MEPVRFDRIMKRIERKLVVEDAAEYERVGVRWYGNGAFVRERVEGANIAQKQQWIVRAGDVVYNKLFAWKGAFAIADEAVDGRLVSSEFPTYELDLSQVNPNYLRLFFRTHQLAFQAGRLSRGAAAISRLRLNPSQFWDLQIPLRSYSEQQRLVEQLEDTETKVLEAQNLRSRADAETLALTTSAIGNCLSQLPLTGSLADVLVGKPRNGWSARCDNAENGVAVLSLGAVTGFTYRPIEHKRTSEPTSTDARYWLEDGDLLMTRSNTEELVGHAAIYNGKPSPCIYPDLIMRLRVDPSKAHTRFVYYWLRTPEVRALIQGAGRGTNSTMKKITQKHVMNLPFPTSVSLENQKALVRSLDELLSQIDELSAGQRATRDDLDALIPSLLDRAFHQPVQEDSLGPAPNTRLLK